ncbi:MAG: BlaI/MecI/CopY family transcriptional regulator [Schleiferiaceae bacterium]
MKEYKELTKAEEQIMQILWKAQKAFVKEIIEQMEEPKPAYNTVSTVVRILEKKGFVGFEAFGKSHRYYPLISKEDYSEQVMNQVVGNYFGGSLKRFVSFFVEKKNVELSELDEILKSIDSKSDSPNSSNSNTP